MESGSSLSQWAKAKRQLEDDANARDLKRARSSVGPPSGRDRNDVLGELVATDFTVRTEANALMKGHIVQGSTAFMVARRTGQERVPEVEQGPDAKVAELEANLKEANERFAGEKTAMEERIADVVEAFMHKSTSLQIAVKDAAEEKASLQKQLREANDNAGIDIRALREYVAKLESTGQRLDQEKVALETVVADQKVELTGLTGDLYEQKGLRKEAVAENASLDSQLQEALFEKEKLAGELKEAIGQRERLRADLAEKDATLTAMAKLHRESEEVGAKKNCDMGNLQKTINRQTSKINGYRNAKKEYVAAKAENEATKQDVAAMYQHYRDLFDKNETMYDKLSAIAEASSFGGVSDAYREALNVLKGTPLHELPVSKNKA